MNGYKQLFLKKNKGADFTVLARVRGDKFNCIKSAAYQKILAWKAWSHFPWYLLSGLHLDVPVTLSFLSRRLTNLRSIVTSLAMLNV